MTRDETIARAEQVLAGITRGAWTVLHDPEADDYVVRFGDGHADSTCMGTADAEFIAAAPRLVRDLVALLREHDQGWRDIESAPTDGTRVLLWNGTRRSLGWWVTFADGTGDWRRQNLLLDEPLGANDLDHETHWHPLHPPPGTKEQNDQVTRVDHPEYDAQPDTARDGQE